MLHSPAGLLGCGVLLAGLRGVLSQCPDYADYSTQVHNPVSSGKYQLSYQRPNATCRTFSLSEVESTISDMKTTIKDPDLFRLFENTFPNTLDTTISWHGFASNNSEEEACNPCQCGVFGNVKSLTNFPSHVADVYYDGRHCGHVAA
jgi:hypothetical protein